MAFLKVGIWNPPMEWVCTGRYIICKQILLDKEENDG